MPAIVLLLVAMAACSPREMEDARRFQLTGTVVGHDISSHRVVVAHDAVNGLMPAMTMAFEVGGAAPAMRKVTAYWRLSS
jgi:Cu/Ag efflux protein CusF